MTGMRIRIGARRAAVLFALPLLPFLAAAAGAAVVDIDLVADDGRTIPAYRIVPPGAPGVHRSFVEAEKGVTYGIRVTNRTGGRVGVVIAVDGRNIISGETSRLRAAERMYILPPYGSETYEGWRTARDTVNRFYFTDPADSYAAAFGDESAVGVISVAVFRERPEPPPVLTTTRPRDREPAILRGGQGAEGRGPAADRALSAPPPAAAKELAPERGEGKAGTGFGEEAWSPSVRVAFRAERHPVERHVMKYEWRETLCRLGIADCRRSSDRFADDGGFAPYPPGRSSRD